MFPRYLSLIMCSLFFWPLVGCGQSRSEGKMDGLTVVVFNYSQESFTTVWIEGSPERADWEAVRPGGYTGGGRACCSSFDPRLKNVELKIEPAEGEPYVIPAVVEQPWPKGANTLIVHILPQRKAVLEGSLGVEIGARSDLINSRLAELGIKKEVDIDYMMLPHRLNYTEYMEIKDDER